ncbi:MAG: S9 family peptidase [Sphingomonadales bacterium]
MGIKGAAMGTGWWQGVRCCVAALALALLAGCGDKDEDKLKTPIPRLLLFGGDMPTGLQLSPDGQSISYIADLDGAPNLWVAPVAAADQPRPVTRLDGPGIRQYDWAADGAHLIFLAANRESGNWHLHAVAPAGGPVRNISPMDGAHARLLAASDSRPGSVYVAMSESESQAGDIYRIDIASGARLLMVKGAGAGHYLAGSDLKPLLRQGFDAGRLIWSIREAGSKGGWRALATVPAEDAWGTAIDGFSTDGLYAFLRDSRDAETLGLARLDLTDGTARVLARHAGADIARVVFDPVTGIPVAYAVEDSRRRWTGLTPDAAATLEQLALLAPGDLDIHDQSGAGRYWLVSFDAAVTPPRYFVYDREAESATALNLMQPSWAEMPTVAQQPRTILSRDGTKLVAYLSLPPERRVNAAGAPDQPSPMVMTVHGGPWARDQYGFSPLHQWLASRGYAVLAVNYRGSTGFGKYFRAAADGAWGTLVPQDLADAARWAVDQGIAHEGKVGLFGGAFGGYAALMALAEAPADFACAVSLAGPVDLVDLVRSIPASGPALPYLFRAYVGDPASAEGRSRLQAQSPVSRIGALAGPVLLAGGGQDPLVPPDSLAGFAKALQSAGRPAAYLNFPNEGHGLARGANERMFLAAAEAFFSQCLGGRVEALAPEQLAAAEVEIRQGAKLIPGLAEAWAAANP